MKTQSLPFLVLVCLFLSGCSGFLPSTSFRGRVVTPSYLAQFRGGGSLSTLWYLGSDKKYHYFAHYVKVSTSYRVRREELRIPDEFRYKSKESVYVGNTTILDHL